MEGKKKYFALIIFLFLGLMIFTFANPAEEEKEFKGGDKEQSETVTNKRQDTTEEDDEDEQDQQQVQQNVVTNNNQGNAQGGNQGNNPGQTPVVPEDTTLRDALAAVEKAEGTYTQDDVDAAKDLVNNVTDTTEKGKLEERLEEVEAGINALALLENLEKQVEEANKKADMNDATDYRNENEIANKIEALNNETVKEELSKRLEEVSKLLDDNAAPTTNIEAKVYADNVEITAEDEAGNPFQVFLTKDEENEEEISSGYKTASDGVYTLRLVDNAFNEQTVTFTVDTTAPALKDLTNGAHYKEITLNTEDKTKVEIKVTNQDTKETTTVEEGSKLTEDATYKVVLTDEGGNTSTYWLAIDSTNPTIENVEDESSINSVTTALIKDKFLTNVTINHVALDKTETKEEFTRVDFNVKANNENFSFEYVLEKEGTYTITATDKKGNTTTKTVIVDMTLAKKNAVNVNVKGYKNTVNEQYATNGNAIAAYISINEELKHNPTFTFYANGKKIKTITDEVVKSNSTNEKYPYVYTATLDINEELVAEDGLITFTVSNIYDLAGNKTEDITKITTKKVITLDRTAAARVYSTIRSKEHGETQQNGKDIDYYHGNGTQFEYAISFNELLKDVPTVTIAGRNVEIKLNEKVLKNENKFLYEGTFKIPADETNLTEGTLEIKVTNVKDLAGNETILSDQTKTSNGRRVIYDVTPAKRMSGNIYVTGVKAIENTYYTQYEKTLYANITTNEKLLNNPTFTFHNNGKEYNADEVIYRGLNDKGYHLYQASYKITKESGMKDGEITFTVSNIKDLAGNKTADVTGPSNRNKVFLDNELNYDKLAIIGAAGEWVNKEYKQYAKTGTIVYVNARFYEKLDSKPVVTLNDTVKLNDYTYATANANGKIVHIYSFSYKLAENDGLKDGTIQVKVTNCKDAAGNSVELTNKDMTLESQSEVIVDRTAPTYHYFQKGTRPAKPLTSMFEADGVVYTTEDVEISISDNYRIKKVITNGETKIPGAGTVRQVRYITAAGVYEYEVLDAVGNSSTLKVVRVDNELDYLNYVDSMKLTKDEILDETITIVEGQTKVIDLNGKTLTIKNPTSVRKIKNYGTLIIKNGKLVNESIESYGLVDNYSTGALTLSNVEVEDKGSYNGSTIKNRGGKVTITDSEFTITSSKGYYATGASDADIQDGKYGNAAVYSEGELIVKNTTINSDSERNYTLRVISGTAEIENVNAKGTHGGLNIDGGTAVVSEFTYESDIHYGIYITNNHVSGTNVTVNGGKFTGQLNGMLVNNELNKGDINVTINAGEFSSKKGEPALMVNKGETTHAMNVTITGGTFKNTDVTAYIDTNVYRQDKSNWTVKEKNKIDSVQYLKEIVTTGGTFTLDNDLTLEDEMITVKKGINLTIDTNGKKITGTSSAKTTSRLFTVENGASLTLTGNGIIEFGALYPDTDWGTEGFPAYATNTIANSGTLVIDGPTLINTTPRGGASYVIDNYAGGHLTVNSGTIKQTGDDQAIRMNTASAGEVNANTVIINGGTITGRRAIWIHLAGSPSTTAPYVNLTVNGGTLSSTDENGYAIYSYSYGNSFANTKVNFVGGTYNGWVAFGSGYKGDQETVTITGGEFKTGIGRFDSSDNWISLQ